VTGCFEFLFFWHLQLYKCLILPTDVLDRCVKLTADGAIMSGLLSLPPEGLKNETAMHAVLVSGWVNSNFLKKRKKWKLMSACLRQKFRLEVDSDTLKRNKKAILKAYKCFKPPKPDEIAGLKNEVKLVFKSSDFASQVLNQESAKPLPSFKRKLATALSLSDDDDEFESDDEEDDDSDDDDDEIDKQVFNFGESAKRLNPESVSSSHHSLLSASSSSSVSTYPPITETLARIEGRLSTLDRKVVRQNFCIIFASGLSSCIDYDFVCVCVFWMILCVDNSLCSCYFTREAADHFINKTKQARC
jgi:hypothetical protein